MGFDKNSQFVSVPVAQAKVSGPNLIKNSNMTSGIQGWAIWPSQVSIANDRRIEVDGPSLRVQFPSTRTEALLCHAGFGLSSNKLYRLSFSAKGTGKSKKQMLLFRSKKSWWKKNKKTF